MFTFLECLRSALISIRAHGFRSILTTLGIIIGVASVIATVSIVQGLSYSISQQFEGLGANSLSVSSYTSPENQMNGHFSRITPDDLQLIIDRTEGIESITPILRSNFSSTIRSGAKSTTGLVSGTTSTYPKVKQLFIQAGRFISESDNQTRRRVCVIGTQVRDDLMLPEDPTGKYIEINSEWIKVVGLAEPKGEMLGFKQDNIVLLPYSTMQSLNGNQTQVNIEIQLTVTHLDEMDKVTEKIRKLLRQAHHIKNTTDDFKIQSSEQMKESFSKITSTITLVMGGLVSISLLVGGIGIMNIMLVSVTERTREIGICKAIGAKRNYILLQFLMESLVLCLLGGLIGLLIGYALGIGVAAIIPNFPPAHIPWWAVTISVGFSAVIGIVFGIVPAAKAANLDPIESLRYE
ncbi:MAG: ABC transporter permease [Pseudomonadota bacterium]